MATTEGDFLFHALNHLGVDLVLVLERRQWVINKSGAYKICEPEYRISLQDGGGVALYLLSLLDEDELQYADKAWHRGELGSAMDADKAPLFDELLVSGIEDMPIRPSKLAAYCASFEAAVVAGLEVS